MTAGAASALLAERRITARIGWDEAAPGAPLSDVTRAAEAAGARARLEGLSDELNPSVPDPGRIEAFLEGLLRQPEEVLSRLEGRVLYLGAPTLHLDAASPFDSAAIAAGYTLTVPDEPPGGLVQPTLSARVDGARVRGLSRAARAAAEAADAEVGDLEPRADGEGLSPDEKRGLLQALSGARSRRFAAASTWREAAETLAAASGDEAAAREAAEARGAVSRFVTPSWTGMPGMRG